ncbi:MAG TPA: hypothetical protein VFG50_03625 [Rhodothermales bacterium]|nr:hypothetical protein [Rhodothermales bacterium]
MKHLTEGYVLHTYGPEKYLRHAIASATTIRRHDPDRPIALFCPDEHAAILAQSGLSELFQVVEYLPEANRSIIGFKHHLHEFKPFDRSLYVDSDMVWCRNPDALWTKLSTQPFTATGLEKADAYFGGPKGIGIIPDILLDRRRRTIDRFGLTHLPRVQAGMIYAQDPEVTRAVCERAATYLSAREETHFRSRLNEGRNEETCEWSLAMAMSSMRLSVFPWLQGYESPQLDFIEGLTRYDTDFNEVSCRLYCDPFIYGLRGIPRFRLRDRLISLFSSLPGKGDYLDVTPFVVHFGWLQHKGPFYRFSERVWGRLTSEHTTLEPHTKLSVVG